MKKKLLALATAVVMVLGLMSIPALAADLPDPDLLKGDSGNEHYELESDNYTLTENITGQIRVPSGVTATLEIADGVTLESGGDYPAIQVDAGGNLTLSGSGEITKSGTAWYLIVNEGTLTIEGDVTIENRMTGNTNATCIENLGDLTINGGTIYGEGIAVKNDYPDSNGTQAGTLTITGGSISSGNQAVQNWGEAEISGGTLTGCVSTWSYDGDNAEGHTTITGGTINGDAVGGAILSQNYSGSEGSTTPSVEVTGGEISGKVSAAGGDITIAGGNFDDESADEFIVDGLTRDENGDVVADEGTVAQIGTKTYTSLAEAIKDAANGTIELLTDIVTESVTQITSNVTIDLKGHSITRTGGATVFYVTAGSLTATNGKLISEAVSANSAAVILTGSASVEFDAIELTATEIAINPQGSSQLTVKNSTIESTTTAAITVGGTASVTIENSTINGATFGISTNGAQTEASAKITLNNGTEITGSTSACGIYLPAGELVVNEGASIEGGAGIVVMGGTLTVNGGTITATGSGDIEVGDSGDAVPAAGIAVNKPASGYPDITSVNITAGTIEGDPSVSYTEGGQDAADSSASNIQISLGVTLLTNGARDGDVDKNFFATENSVVNADGVVVQGYTITVADTENGTVTITIDGEEVEADEDGSYLAAEGAEITITATPENGYEVDEVTVETAEVSGTYTFTMPASDVTVTVTFKETEDDDDDDNSGSSGSGSSSTTTPSTPSTPVEPEYENPYDDVDEESGAWYLDTVQYVTENGLMEGYDEGDEHLFGVGENITRAQLVQILYNMEGKPASDGECVFPDVNEDGWYVDAILWAAENGIVDGYEDGTFRPDDCITREETAAVLYRYAEYKGCDVSAEGDLGVFADAEAVSEWAAEYVTWAVGAGIILGHDDGTVAPQGSALREEAAAMLQRFHQNFVKQFPH